MKKLKYILIIFCFTLYYSCDSFLDVRPEGEVVNNELSRMPKVLKMPFTGCTPRWPVRLITVVR